MEKKKRYLPPTSVPLQLEPTLPLALSLSDKNADPNMDGLSRKKEYEDFEEDFDKSYWE